MAHAILTVFSDMTQKTRSAFKQRFKITGGGKVIRRSSNRRHLLRNKSVKQKRNSGQDHVMADGQARHIKLGLPHR